MRLLAFAFFTLALLSGCAKKPRSLAGIGAGGLPPGDVGDPCAVPNTGCACETDGEKVECGSTVSQVGDMLTCAKGKRVCQDSKWSECLDTHLEEQTVHGGADQWRPQALGSQAKCPDGYDDCDPYCKYQDDVPDSTIDAGTGLTVTDAGLTLSQTGMAGCSSLTIATRSPSTAASLNMAVTGISPTFTTDQLGNKVNFQVTALPNGCIPAPFDVTWTIDKFDRAAVSGTKNNDGAVTLALGVAGPIKVTAYGAGHSASTTINVRVNVVEAPSTQSTPTTPNRKASSSDQNLFGVGCSSGASTCWDAPLVGVGSSTASFLYPYPATWFPLGLVPPVIQYTYSTATGNNQATKVSLRYPKNNTLANVIAKTTPFNYSLIVAETNNYRQYADCGPSCAQPLDPQVIFAQSVWSAFERTVRGFGDITADYDADIYVQRVKSGVLEQEYRWPTAIHFAGGYLKGTVYYNSYNSTIGGSTATNVVGAVLKINPGDSSSAPTAAIPGSAGKCTSCHSVSGDGSTLTIASGDASGTGCAGGVSQGSTYRENACSFTMPAGTLKKTHAGNTAEPYKFIWGAPYPDGSFYVNNTWDNTRILDSAFPFGSTGYGITPGVYRTVDGAVQAAGGVPAAPVTPTFSRDGTMFAYNSGTLNGNIANPAVVVSENQACSVATGVKPSEVSACGQAYGLTLSEVASCPGVTLSEISSCGSSPGGVNVSEVSSCGQTPVVNVAEISACNGVTFSEIQSCGVAPAANIAEVSACTGPTISEILSCGNVTANGPVISEVEVCGITPNASRVVISEISPRIQFGGVTAGESVELRNDGNAAVDISGWTVRRTVPTAITTCGTVPGGITLLPGATYVVSYGTACLQDASGTVRLYNSGGTAQAGTNQSHAYTTTVTNQRSVLSCAGVWAESQLAALNDATNNSCSIESAEIRNDTAVALNISSWTVNNGATLCATVPASTTVAPGAVYRVYTTSGACFTDAGATLTLKNASATTMNTRAYAAATGCSATVQKHSILSCAQGWLDNVAGADDTANNACTNFYESVEIRNDTPAALNISSYTVRQGATTCGTVPASTSLAAGAVYRVYTNGNCITDLGSTLTLNNSGGTAIASRVFTSACTGLVPVRNAMTCGGAWGTALSSANDTTNDACTNTEEVEIRNDSGAALNPNGWTVRAGAGCAGTVCATLPSTSIAPGATYSVATTSCLADTASTVTLCNGATTVSSHAYTACSPTAPTRSVLSCAGAWTDSSAGSTLDTTNDTCAVPSYEWFEIRNDRPAAVDISSWTVRQGATTCATIPSSTSIAAGAVYRGYTATGTCITDAGSTLSLNNSGGTAQAQHAFTSTCTTAAPSRAVMTCGGTWTQNNAGGTNDTANDVCTNTESIDIRNDAGAAVDPTGWTLKAGVGCAGTTCATVAGGSLASGTTRHVPTTSGACFADTASSVTLCNGATQVSTHAYTACTPDAPTRSVLSCGNAWTDSAAGATFDTAADTCSSSFEWVEIRNDTPSSVNVSSYTVRNGAGTTCLTVPAATTLASGAVYRGYTTTGTCFTDASDTARVYDSGGALLTSRAFTSTCSVGTPKRGALACTGTWSNDLTMPPGNDTANEGCTQSSTAEWVEIRNDTPASLNISSWTVRNGGTTCATVPASTTLAAGTAWRGYTTTGACLPDAGSTLTLNDSGGASQASRAYTSTCTATVGNRSVLACHGARTDDVASAVNDTTNDTCTNKEGVDIRNDTLASVSIANYTVKNGATTCATVPAATNLAAGATYHLDTTNCLADGTGTVTLNNGATVVSTKAYNYSCSPAQLRSVLSCAGAWTESVAPTTAAFDATNNTCASQQFEAVEIRNDTPSTVDISSWTARNGATVCATVPAATTLSTGLVYRLYPTSGACLTDGSGTVTLYNAAGTAQSTQNYTAACGTRATLSCSGTWTNSQAGTGNDSANDSCAASQSFEWIEIRNDTSASADVSGWTVKSGATTCITVPNSTTLAAGAVYQGYTPTGGCMPDAGGTLSVYDASNNLQSTRAYTSTCSVATPKRGYQPCANIGNTWLNDQSGGTASAVNNSCAFSGSYDSSGTTIRVKDFTCGASPGSVACVGSTKTFSNERTVVNCADAAQAGHVQCTRPSYPSFLPNNFGLLFQHQIVDSTFESGINSANGATAEIWITRASTKAPVALDKLNGWDGTSAVTIPTRPRHSALANPTGAGGTYDPTWHPGTITNSGWHYDQCAVSSLNSVSMREDRLNYFPMVSPQEAGGAYWAIFTSRRLYGNVAVSNAWQVQRSDNAANRFGMFNGGCSDAYSPGSGFIETKKLWVSAIDKSWNGTGDPSHPPFYLPGQELKAGNSHGYWVSAACAAEGAACETDDDCCGGTGTTPTEMCKITNTATVPPTRQCHPVDECSDVGEACAATADCCTGLTCPVGGGVCLAVGGGAYSSATYTREYVATCPSGTRVKWQNFEWQATLPALTEIDFYVQTKALVTDTYLPSVPALLKKALPPAPVGWDSANVDATLQTNNLASLDYLMVSMTLRPDADGLVAPVLKNWRLVYDCLPAE